jgi:hypothetical protein
VFYENEKKINPTDVAIKICCTGKALGEWKQEIRKQYEQNEFVHNEVTYVRSDMCLSVA